jgi:hypothetical protein
MFICGALLGFAISFLIPANAQVSFALAVNARDELEVLEKYLGVDCDRNSCKKIQIKQTK